MSYNAQDRSFNVLLHTSNSFDSFDLNEDSAGDTSVDIIARDSGGAMGIDLSFLSSSETQDK